MCGPEPRLFVTPLLLPREEKGLGDEVGKHAQFVFCEEHRIREESFVAGSSSSCRTPRSSTRTRTQRDRHRNDEQ